MNLTGSTASALGAVLMGGTLGLAVSTALRGIGLAAEGAAAGGLGEHWERYGVLGIVGFLAFLLLKQNGKLSDAAVLRETSRDRQAQAWIEGVAKLVEELRSSNRAHDHARDDFRTLHAAVASLTHAVADATKTTHEAREKAVHDLSARIEALAAEIATRRGQGC